LRSLLEESGEVQVVGEAADGYQALDMVAELRPDVVVMDIAMPRLNGIDATRAVRQRSPGTRVVVLTMYDSAEYVAEILKAGAWCYVTKDAAWSDLLQAIRYAKAGAKVILPGSAVHGQDLLGDGLSGEVGLTPREQEVLHLLARGLTNVETAEHLSLSLHTVRAHRSSIMRKLGVHNAAELVNAAMRRGLV
jgi:DNA-binding NarL/FixJ family response regulator